MTGGFRDVFGGFGDFQSALLGVREGFRMFSEAFRNGSEDIQRVLDALPGRFKGFGGSQV